MLRDLECGRQFELDALVSAVREIGRLVELPTATIHAVAALRRCAPVPPAARIAKTDDRPTSGRLPAPPRTPYLKVGHISRRTRPTFEECC